MSVYRHDIPNARVPRTRAELETALDTDQLWCHTINGKHFKCRRNGKTRSWKRRPREFTIPIKYGFSGHTFANDGDLNMEFSNAAFLIEG